MPKLGASVYRPPNSVEDRNSRCIFSSPGVMVSTVVGTAGRTTAAGPAAYSHTEALRVIRIASFAANFLGVFTPLMVAVPAAAYNLLPGNSGLAVRILIRIRSETT